MTIFGSELQVSLLILFLSIVSHNFMYVFVKGLVGVIESKTKGDLYFSFVRF